jgi:hypothetical protein
MLCRGRLGALKLSSRFMSIPPLGAFVSSLASLMVANASESKVSIAHHARPLLKIFPVLISSAGRIGAPKR